ncbi:hypothetical protein [Streptomyces sp. CHB9.2]|uniref:hypothetical protein n=1 Tax=Streptomyces sp. CHB9.2 TaxID=2841670 RepID=UPI002094EA6C|nr:hypothetical protein [Streptomyces sp. CHB9.2]MCO6704766.1 hypothetical protein [Streptomyces sp. CHB9.2]
MQKLSQKVVELAQMHGDFRDYKGMEPFDPNQFINNVILDWAADDVFFRGFDRHFLESIRHPDLETNLVVFKKEGMNCYFGYPESRSAIMNQMDLRNYSAEITAAMMIVVSRAGFEFLGVFKAQHIIDYRFGSDGSSPETKRLSVDKSMVGKVIRQVEHVGFTLKPEAWGQNMPLLVPQDNLFMPEALR